MIGTPSLMAKVSRDPPITVPTVLRRQLDDPTHQPWLIAWSDSTVSMGRSRLTHHPTGPALRHAHNAAHMLDRTPSSVRAQYFPEDTSFKIAMSIAWSATSFFNRCFPVQGPSGASPVPGAAPCTLSASGNASAR